MKDKSDQSTLNSAAPWEGDCVTIFAFVSWCSIGVLFRPFEGLAQKNSEETKTGLQHTPIERDGQHDFDFEIGAWKTHLSRLLHPLTGSTTWVEYGGTTVVRKVWNERANLVELKVDGPKGHIEALSLRLYNPRSHQWSLNFANSNGGGLSQPTIGEFKDVAASFRSETLNDRAILVRFVISISPNSCRFEQAFSTDGGKTWEVNWIATRHAGRKMNLTKRTELVRIPSRGSHDWETISKILDAGFLASVGFCLDGQPFVIPMLYGREGGRLYLHGSAASRLLQQLETGIPTCVTVTL